MTRRTRNHRRRAVQSRPVARKRTGRKVFDLNNPVSRRTLAKLSPKASWSSLSEQLSRRRRVRSPTAMLAAMAAMDQALR